MNDLSLNVFEIDISSDSDEEVFTPSPIHRRRPSQAISYTLYRNPIIFDHIRTKRYFTYLMLLLYTISFFSGAIVLKRSIDAINPNAHVLFLKFVHHGQILMICDHNYGDFLLLEWSMVIFIIIFLICCHFLRFLIIWKNIIIIVYCFVLLFLLIYQVDFLYIFHLRM